MRILVCGGRHHADRLKVHEALTRLHLVEEVTEVIHGDAVGVDTLAGAWARMHHIPVRRYQIEPGEGGFARNERMLRDSAPDAVVHFPGGNGTRHMVQLAVAGGYLVVGALDTACNQLELLEEIVHHD